MMKWINNNHPVKIKFSGLSNMRKALVRKQCGKNKPCYVIDTWFGDKWKDGDSGGNIITHYMWITEPKHESTF